MVMAPVVRGRKGEYGKLSSRSGSRATRGSEVDGELRRLDEEIDLDKKYKHDISVVVDRLVMKADLRRRLSESVEAAAGARRRAWSKSRSSTAPNGAGGGSEAEQAGERDALLASSSPASTAAPRSPSWSRGSSPSTRPTAPASAATGSASSG